MSRWCDVTSTVLACTNLALGGPEALLLQNWGDGEDKGKGGDDGGLRMVQAVLICEVGLEAEARTVPVLALVTRHQPSHTHTTLTHPPTLLCHSAWSVCPDLAWRGSILLKHASDGLRGGVVVVVVVWDCLSCC